MNDSSGIVYCVCLVSRDIVNCGRSSCILGYLCWYCVCLTNDFVLILVRINLCESLKLHAICSYTFDVIELRMTSSEALSFKQTLRRCCKSGNITLESVLSIACGIVFSLYCSNCVQQMLLYFLYLSFYVHVVVQLKLHMYAQMANYFSAKCK